ncbi:hypothetical protein NDU88_011501 [Pleurodeles waltl]|uniref:Uncharacterized protein n=1 Tax=Pleurodeles waltl TaxID=8319 RepID=A0AAV7R166_PLEWA|nr:hypothetical protein NDU88_011501 [Pleurodeles waltl]
MGPVTLSRPGRPHPLTHLQQHCACHLGVRRSASRFALPQFQGSMCPSWLRCSCPSPPGHWGEGKVRW